MQASTGKLQMTSDKGQMTKPAKLALEDGTVFTGISFGAEGEVDGEVCFNTSMTGYQEILTDPSYRGQIVTMTYTEMGNYGVNAEDVESSKPHLAGFVVKEFAQRPSNFRSEESLDAYLRRFDIVGLAGIDTRTVPPPGPRPAAPQSGAMGCRVATFRARR